MVKLRGRVIDEGEGARFVPHQEQELRLRLTKLEAEDGQGVPEEKELLLHSGTHVTVVGQSQDEAWIWGVNHLDESYLPLPRQS